MYKLDRYFRGAKLVSLTRYFNKEMALWAEIVQLETLTPAPPP